MKTIKSMDKLQVDVELWHIKTFPKANNKAILDKAFEEIREFTAEAVHGYDEMYEEAADIVLVFMALFARNNKSLEKEVRLKFDINQSRAWGKEDKNGGKERIK